MIRSRRSDNEVQTAVADRGNRRLILLGALAALLVAGGLFLIAAAKAQAQKEIVAVSSSDFLTKALTIDQGESVTFRNSDPAAPHDVTSRASGPYDAEGRDAGSQGSFAFRSKTIRSGSTPVEGTEYQTSGDYGYYCSVHPWMTGTLTVSSAGTPKQRPQTPAPAAPDTTGPKVRVSIRDRRARTAARRNRLRARVTSNEAGKISARATAKRGKRTVTVAKGSATLKKAGSRTVSMKLTRAGRSLLRRSRRVRVTVIATVTDAAGNRTRKRASRTLRR